MAEVIDSMSVPYVDEDDDFESNLHLLWDCDDEVGYGVEFSDDEAGIASWSFGDKSIESYLLTECWFEFLCSILTATNNLPEHIIDDYCIWIEDESPTEEDEEKVLKMIELMTVYFGYHPLEEKRVNEVRSSFGWPKEDRIWTKFIKETKLRLRHY